MDKPSLCAHKEMSISCFSDDQVWRKFSVLTNRVMLHFKDQVFPTITEVDLRLCFSLHERPAGFNKYIIVILFVAAMAA